MDKASEHSHNDCWNEESELSARYGLEHDDIPNLGEQAPRRIHMGNWSTHESTKNHMIRNDVVLGIAQTFLMKQKKE